MLRITKETQGNTVVLFLEGRIDTNTAPELETELKDLTDVTALILDFGKVDYVSSAGLRVLLSAQKKIGGQGGMKLIRVGEAVMEILEITGFTDILNIE